MFTFFFHITYTEPTFFLCLGRVLYSFVSLNQLPTFYPWTLKVVKYLWGFCFLIWRFFFLPITLSLGHLHHLSLSFSSSMLRNSSLLISSGCIFRILKNDCWHSLDHLFFISTYAGFEFHFQCYHFLFHHDIFIFIDKSIFWSDNFLRCHLSLSLKDSEEVQVCALLSVHELTDNQWPTGNGFWKIILVTDYEIHLFFVEWFMD